LLDGMGWCKDNALAVTRAKVKEIEDLLLKRRVLCQKRLYKRPSSMSLGRSTVSLIRKTIVLNKHLGFNLGPGLPFPTVEVVLVGSEDRDRNALHGSNSKYLAYPASRDDTRVAILYTSKLWFRLQNGK